MVTRLRPLDRKLVRDLRRLRGPSVAIAIVTACGIASFVALRSMYHHLGAQQEAYYRDGRFADVFASVERAPRAMLRQVAAVPGVTRVDARVTADVSVDVPGLAGPAHARLVGVPTTTPLALNLVFVRSGAGLSPGARDEVLASEGFATANALAPGDTIAAVIAGRRRKLRIAGIALAPEYAYEVPPGQMLPDPRRFGVLWMADDQLAPALGLDAAWNDLAVDLAPGAHEPAVIAAVDRLLQRYGSRGAYGRELHVSHRYLAGEIEQNAAFATVMPAIFLGVAAFLIHLVLSRVVSSQREQIGMLKAFGFPPLQVARHYTLLALAPVMSGALAGSALGLVLADGLAAVYADVFRIPGGEFTPRVGVIGWALLIAAAAAVAGAGTAVRRVLRLPAAEAMRPEPPARYRAGGFERSGLAQAMHPVARMIVRTVLRRPMRSALSVLGMAFGVAVVIVGLFAFDSFAVVRDVLFTRAQREDVAVTFVRPQGDAALRELEHLEGVLRVEPTYALPVRLRHEHRERQVALVGVAANAELRRIVSGADALVVAPPGGLLLSDVLAGILGVGVGDSVDLEMILGRQRQHRVPVAATVHDYLGVAAYASLDEYRRWSGEWSAMEGAVLAVDARRQDSVMALLERMPGVQTVTARAAAVRAFDDAIEQSFNVTLITLVVFAVAIAAGVAYNAVRIALAERGRDLASLRVLGFTRAEVARMLFGEQGLLAVAAVPVGWALGILLSWWIVVSFESDLYRLPFVIHARTFAAGAAALAGSGVLAALLVRRPLDRLDLVAVLKTRE